VEGLTEQSGHWPLPKEVAEMLAWLDQVSADTARGAIEVALGGLRSEAPDFASVVPAAVSAERLIKNAKPDEKPLLTEQHAALLALIGDVAAKHALAISQRPDSRKPESPFGAWASHFRRANRELDAWPGWQTSMKDLRQRATAHEKTISAAVAKLEKTQGVAFVEGVKALESAFLAPGYDDLVARLSRLSETPPKGLRQEEIAKLKVLLDARKADDESGSNAAAAIATEAVEPFRKAHPAWFE
jgi:hypothetical protein